MKFNRPFSPGFIKKLDEKLLLNSPDTWSSRAHLVAFYCLLFMIMLTGICLIVPNDPRSRSAEGLWIILVSLISFIGFITWLIFLLRFNVFKRFGNLDHLNGLKTFLLYFISIGLMVLCPLIPPAVESLRANMAYTGEELVEDVNSINSKVLLLEHDSIPLKWRTDTFLVVNSIQGREVTVEAEDYVVSTVDPHRNFLRIIDTTEFKERAFSIDSLHQLNDSMYVFFECPGYEFVSNYQLEDEYPQQYLDSKELYYRYVLKYNEPDKVNTIKELLVILKKYDPYHTDKFVIEREDYDWEYMNKIKSKYDLYVIDRSIQNITSRKYWWDGYTIPVISRVCYYITLTLTLLLIVLRRTTIKTFFLTLLAAILITILSSLVLAFSRADAVTLNVLLLFYYCVFGGLSFVLLGGRVRNVFNGMAMNLFVFFTAFVPFIIVSLYYAILRAQYRYQPEPAGIFDNEMRNLFFGEIAGFGLLLLLMAFLFTRLYRAWYALPEQ